MSMLYGLRVGNQVNLDMAQMGTACAADMAENRVRQRETDCGLYGQWSYGYFLTREVWPTGKVNQPATRPRMRG